MLWGLDQQQGTPPKATASLSLINGHALQISQGERWCCSYPTLPGNLSTEQNLRSSPTRRLSLKKKKTKLKTRNLILARNSTVGSGQNTDYETALATPSLCDIVQVRVFTMAFHNCEKLEMESIIPSLQVIIRMRDRFVMVAILHRHLINMSCYYGSNT